MKCKFKNNYKWNSWAYYYKARIVKRKNTKFLRGHYSKHSIEGRTNEKKCSCSTKIGNIFMLPCKYYLETMVKVTWLGSLKIYLKPFRR